VALGLAAKLPVELFIELGIAVQQPAFRERRENGGVRERQAARFGGSAGREPNLEPQVEEMMREWPHELEQLLITAKGMQQHQVHVGEGGHFPAAKSAMGDQGHARREPLVRHGIVKEIEHDLFKQLREVRADLYAWGSAGVLQAELVAAQRKLFLRGDHGSGETRSGDHALEGVLSLFTRADADDVLQVGHEDFAVPDLARLRRPHDGI
jgi:hypothetical protein